jgi:hypothetical protein
MSNPTRLQRARLVWRAIDVPVPEFRSANAKALSYGIECDLDHHASYLGALLAAWDRRDPHWDFRMRVGSELAELSDLRTRLEALEEDLPPHAGELFAYIDRTAELLHALLEASG